MNKVAVIGHFGLEKNFFDGQTVKTNNIYNVLEKTLEKKEIIKVDTYNWKKHPIKLLKRCINAFKDSENIIVLPAHNGVRIFMPLFIFLNKRYNRKIFYIVIGGWLAEFLRNKRILKKQLKKINKILVETNKLKNDLENNGFDNIDILVNFKNINPLKKEELRYDYQEPYKLCFFARVTEEKGIEDAIDVVKKINEETNKIVCVLDIYGSIDDGYQEKFKRLQNTFPSYIEYKGVIDSEKSVEIIKEYYLLLFPTKFKTEGIPGTIIDALCAGVPVISSEYDNVYDILENGENGFVFEFGNKKAFENTLRASFKMDVNQIMNMKNKCLIDAQNFTADKAIEYMKKLIS